MLNQELLTKIKKIQYKANYLTTQSLMGEYISAFKGRGIEFEEAREYIEGDDIRTIDWNVTARMNKPFVKVYKEEREIILMLLIDVSKSMMFGSCSKTKNELAAELGAILAFLATKNNDKVGLIIFSEQVEKYIPPKKGRSHIWNVIKLILSHESSYTKTNIKNALEFLLTALKKKCSCFLISDFLDINFEKILNIVSKKHDINCIKLYDPAEYKIPKAGVIELEDLEENKISILLNTNNTKIIQEFYLQEQLREKKFKNFLIKNKIDYITYSINDDVVKKLEELFNKKIHKIKR